MTILDELTRYKTSELKDTLNRNKYLLPKELVLSRDNNIYEVLCRHGNSVYLCDSNGVAFTAPIEEIVPLTFEVYLKALEERVRNKYTDPLQRWKIRLAGVLRWVYPTERFEIYVEDTSRIVVTVHYPEVVVTNSLGLTHNIKDLYIRYTFWLEIGKLKLEGLQAIKSSWSIQELEYDYLHSHIHINSKIKWSTMFCFGSRNAVSDTISSAKVLGFEKDNLEGVTQLFLTMNSYLSWESLEGNPYRQIARIYERVLNPIEVPIALEDINSCIQFIFSKTDHFKYKIDVVNDSPKISVITNFYDLIKEYVIRNRKKQYIVYRDSNGDDRELSSENFSRYDRLKGSTVLIFKGQPVKFNLLPSMSAGNFKRQNKKKISSRFEKRVVDRISSSFRDFLIKEKENE